MTQIKAYINSIPELSKKELVILGDLNWDYNDSMGLGCRYLNELEIEFGIKLLPAQPTVIQLDQALLT